MDFLRDCAVITLIQDFLAFSHAFKEICECYKKLVLEYEKAATFEEHMIPHPVLDEDVVHLIGDTSRRVTHGDRHGGRQTRDSTTRWVYQTQPTQLVFLRCSHYTYQHHLRMLNSSLTRYISSKTTCC